MLLPSQKAVPTITIHSKRIDQLTVLILGPTRTIHSKRIEQLTVQFLCLISFLLFHAQVLRKLVLTFPFFQ